MEQSTCARPYARAAFETALKQDRLENWSNFLQAAVAVTQDSRVKGFLRSSRKSRNEKMALCSDLLGEFVEKKGLNFLRLLLENERLLLLPQIASIYEELKYEERNEAVVTVLSAFPMDHGQRERLVQRLNRRFDKEVSICVVVDNDLIGGLVIKFGDLVIDGSVRSKLSAMANAVKF